MKTGRTLTELAQEVERQEKSKRDFIASTDLITMEMDQDLFPDPERKGEYIEKPILALRDPGANIETFKITPHCHSQIANRLNIPKQYYDKMLAKIPWLLRENVNSWLQLGKEKRMVRTLNGHARAFLSDRYRPLDNFDMMNSVLPVLMEQEEMQIVSCEITETRLYLKALFPKFEGEVSKGDPVQAGLVISNSEIGCGSVRVEPLIYRLVCLNGMITQAKMRKYHIGKNGAEDANIMELLSDATREQSDKAFWMQVQDVVRGSLTEDIFLGNLNQLKIAKGQKIEGNVQKVVELTQKQFQFSESETSGILKHLIEGGDLTQYGMANAITRTSQDVDDYDRASQLERDGGKIIELSPRDWQSISKAA